jgi:E3 ubiquitin-protein ligase synoviolin
MDQVPPPGPPKSFHLRMTALFLFLVTADVLLLSLSLKLVLPPNRLNGKVLFVSEYTILTTAWINVVGKYGVNLWEKYREYSAARARAAAIAEAGEGDEEEEEEEEEEEDDRGWEGKSMVVFYIDLVTGPSIRLSTFPASQSH